MQKKCVCGNPIFTEYSEKDVCVVCDVEMDEYAEE